MLSLNKNMYKLLKNKFEQFIQMQIFFQKKKLIILEKEVIKFDDIIFTQNNLFGINAG